MNTQQWTRARADVRKRTTRSKGRTSTRVTGRGELSTLAGAREAHSDAGRVPMAVVDHALDNVRETAHGADGDALAQLADRWAHAIGADLPALIGTERYAWSEAGTMPTDPAILASIATTTCGITGGVHHGADVALMGPAIVRKRKRATFPARLSAGTYVRRATDPRGKRTRYGRRNVRPDVWHDPVTETVRPRLRWDVIALPAIGHDPDRMFIGHGPDIARGESTRDKRKRTARAVRESVCTDRPIVDTIRATVEHAQRSADPVGRWEWHAADDARGVVTISARGAMGVSGHGLRVRSARTIGALLKNVEAQLAQD